MSNPINLGNTLSTNIINKGTDLGIDYAELTLDNLMEEGIKEVPIVKSIYAAFQIGQNIRNVHFTKKFITFLNEYHNGQIQEEQLAEFKNKYRDNEKYRSEINENILIIIDRLNSESKVKILTNLFIAFIEGKYDWDTFLDLSFSIEQALKADIKLINYLSQYNDVVEIEEISITGLNLYMIIAAYERISRFGFVDEGDLFDLALTGHKGKKIRLSKFGRDFFEWCIKEVA